MWKGPAIKLPNVLSRLVGRASSLSEDSSGRLDLEFCPFSRRSAVPKVLERSDVGGNRAGSADADVSEVWSLGVSAQAVFGASPWFVRGGMRVLG